MYIIELVYFFNSPILNAVNTIVEFIYVNQNACVISLSMDIIKFYNVTAIKFSSNANWVEIR